jgi:hypothetical protein
MAPGRRSGTEVPTIYANFPGDHLGVRNMATAPMIAKAKAQRFLRKYRRSPTAPRVAEACAPRLAAAGIAVP